MIERLRTLNDVLLLAAANALLWWLLEMLFPGSSGGDKSALSFADVPFDAIRIAIAAYAGWIIVRWKKGGLWRAAFAGALVLLIDHAVVRGSMYLLQGEPAAFLGVLVSYIMFVWIAMLVGLLGGITAKIVLARQHA